MIVSIHPKDDLDNAVAMLAAIKKVERVACYRQLQAESQMIEDLTGKGLGGYVLPAGVHLRPVTGSEKRVLWKGEGAHPRIVM